MSRAHRTIAITGLLVLVASVASAQTSAKTQPRPHGTRLVVPLSLLHVDVGDTVSIRWSEKDEEIVRILGIDAPETRHVEHNLPYAQPFGRRHARSRSAHSRPPAGSKCCALPRWIRSAAHWPTSSSTGETTRR